MVFVVVINKVNGVRTHQRQHVDGFLTSIARSIATNEARKLDIFMSKTGNKRLIANVTHL